MVKLVVSICTSRINEFYWSQKNILNDTFKILGVGVDFNDEKQPFGQKIILVNVFGMRLRVMFVCKGR